MLRNLVLGLSLLLEAGSHLEWTVYLGGWSAETELTLEGTSNTDTESLIVNRPGGNVGCVAGIGGLARQMLEDFQQFSHRCKVEIADGVLKFSVNGGGDFVIAVKDNQPKLLQAVKDLVAKELQNDFDVRWPWLSDQITVRAPTDMGGGSTWRVSPDRSPRRGAGREDSEALRSFSCSAATIGGAVGRRAVARFAKLP